MAPSPPDEGRGRGYGERGFMGRNSEGGTKQKIAARSSHNQIKNAAGAKLRIRISKSEIRNKPEPMQKLKRKQRPNPYPNEAAKDNTLEPSEPCTEPELTR